MHKPLTIQKEKVLFRKEILRLKKLGTITEAANVYGGYTSLIFLRGKKRS